jgi:hypothetical protein
MYTGRVKEQNKDKHLKLPKCMPKGTPYKTDKYKLKWHVG